MTENIKLEENTRNKNENNEINNEISFNYKSLLIYGNNSKNFPLPFYKIINFPLPPEEYPVNPGIIAESCGGKIISGIFIGGILGVGMGLFMSAMGGDISQIQVWKGREIPPPPVREQIRAGYKGTLGKMKGWSKNFAILTALFGGVECVIEKYRSKHDVWNPVASGCVVGATLSASGGPTAACLGCVGFAGFSYLMDKVMGPEH
mmetsp:Transcript_10004/g.10490  ORF Transcript_10004/g.10490 Transcript_10004/m.10490 type:complete len:205 (+) Transcript_10004:3-617(+)